MITPSATPPRTTPITGGSSVVDQSASSHAAGSRDGTLDPENGSVNQVMPLEGLDLGSFDWSPITLDEPEYIFMPPDDWPAPPGKGKYADQPREDFSRVFRPGLMHNSQVNMNRMTGNWWFPLDVFVVPQANGDLWLYEPGVVGAIYASSGGGFVSPPGAFDIMVANGNGTWTRTTKHGTQWLFNSSGYLIQISDRYGKTRTLTRDAQNKLLSWTDYAGRTTSASYYSNGYLSTITDWTGRAWTFTYTAQGYLASLSYPSTSFYDRASGNVVTRAKTVSFTYVTGTGTARDGNVLQVVDDLGNVAFSSTYDSLDRATSSTTYGRTWNYAYLANGATRVVEPDGITVDYTFGPGGAISSKAVYTASGLGLTPLRPGEPSSYVWTYQRTSPCGCGQISRVTRPDGSVTEATYDAWGNITQRKHFDKPGGSGQTLTESWTWSSFAQFSQVLTYTSAMGNGGGGIPADHTTTWAYDALGSVTSVTQPRAALTSTTSYHPVTTFVRNPQGQATSITFPGGTQTTIEYVPVSLEAKKIIRDFGGVGIVEEYTYDTLSRPISYTSPRGKVTTWSYNALSQVTDMEGPQPLAPKASFLRDNNDRIREIALQNKDSAGVVVSADPEFARTYTYSAANQLISVSEEIDAANSATVSYTYTPGGRVSVATDPNGHQVKAEYDERGLVFRVTEGYGSPVAATRQTDYDVVGRVSKVIDALGNFQTISYNHVDWMISRVHPNGGSEVLEWNADGYCVGAKAFDAGAVLRMRSSKTFDALGRTTTSTRYLLDAQGATVASYVDSLEYNVALRLSKVTNSLGNATTHTYDALGRVTKSVGPTLDEVVLVYDADGNVTRTTLRDWNAGTSAFEEIIQEHTYDDLGRNTNQVLRDPGSTLTTTSSASFDGLGRVVSATDALGNVTNYEWDARGLLLKETRELRAGGGAPGGVTSTVVTQRQYDVAGQLISQSDGLAQGISYVYDARGRVVTTTDAASGTTTFAYDPLGNETSRTDANGSVAVSTYDNMGRVTARTITRGTGVLGTTAEGFSYDALGRLISATDDDSTVQFTYDSLGRKTSETQGPNPLGGAGSTFSYGYNSVGSMTSTTYPSGIAEVRTLDVGERLSTVSLASGPTLASYSWVGERITQLALQNGVTRTESVDVLRRPTRVKYTTTSTTLKDFEYRFNAAGVRLLEKRHHAGGAGDLYELDSLYRTAKVKQGVADPVAELNNPGSQTVASTIVPTYDAANNRSSVATTTGGATTTVSFVADALNAYTSVGGNAHFRDANGNMTDDGTHLYDYDYRNQLVRVRLKAGGGVVALYDYDVMGRRTVKAVGATTTTFLWRGSDLAVESDGSGLVSRRHLGARVGEVVSATQRDVADLNGVGGTTDYVALTPLYDGGFDCAGVLGPAGAVAESYVHTYDGQVTVLNAAGTAIPATAIAWYQGYGHMYRDDETQLLYSVFRFYSPNLGRFITRDPVGDWFTEENLGNGYAWIGNSYRDAMDPLGLDKCCGKRYAVVVQNDPIVFNKWKKDANGNKTIPQPLPPVAQAAGNAVSQLALNILLSNIPKSVTVKKFTWNKDNLEEAKKGYASWMSKNGNCVNHLIIWGHGRPGDGFPEFFGQSMSPADIFGTLTGKTLQLDTCILGTCHGALGKNAWKPYAVTTVGTPHVSTHPSNWGMPWAAARAIRNAERAARARASGGRGGGRRR